MSSEDLSPVAQDHWAAKWHKYTGKIPVGDQGAFSSGGHAIGRGRFNDGLHIGYVDAHRHRLIIGWGGEQQELEIFEILCGDENQFVWKECEGPCRPQFFIPLKGGHESDGKELYIARALDENLHRVGKAGKHLVDGMSYAHDGREIVCNRYEVLAFL